MKIQTKAWGCGMVAMCMWTGCTTDDGGNDDNTPACELPAQAQAAVDRYAEGVYAQYDLTLTRANALKSAVDSFVAAPSAQGLNAARTAWLSAREPYGETEAFRFYGGPIDSETDGVEGQVNAWPMDEAYVDYVDNNGTPMVGGIINDTSVTLSAEQLLSLNEQGGEANISTGWHAIEFLLWGQDLSTTGPGNRPFTDFVDGAMATAPNAARRRQYLTLVTDQLIADLTSVRDAWAASTPGNYRAQFVADPKVALGHILKGMGSLSGAELSGERMAVAWERKDQEDEHSCFSDNTHNDIIGNARGIQNIWLGRYAGSTSGVSLRDLVQAKDPDLATHMDESVSESMAAVNAIPAPFDQAILGADDAAGRVAVKAAIDALRHQTDETVEVAAAICVDLNLAEE